MGLTNYKPLFLYATALATLGITASIFQSTDLLHVCIAAYVVGWVVFIWNAVRTKRR